MYIVYLSRAHKIPENELKALFDLIPRRFKSSEYAEGFIDALGFGKLHLTTAEKYEALLEQSRHLNKPPCKSKFVTIEQEPEDKER